MLLSLAMLFTLAPTAFAADSESQPTTMSGNCGAPAEEGGEVTDAVTWSFESDTGTLTISGTGAMADYTVDTNTGKDTRPWSAYKDTITEVSISEGVTSIGDSAFRSMTALKEANIPASITDLGDHIFRGDTALTTVKWADEFSAPKITDTDSNSDTYEGYYVPTSMFDGCTSLGIGVELTEWLPSSFTGVGCAAFRGTQFTVNFGDWSNLNYIGAYAFSEMPNLDSFTLTDRITIGLRGGMSNAFTKSGLKSLTIDVETVPSRFAFSARELAKIVLTDKVTNINAGAFHGTAITELVIPSGVKKLGEWSFLNCSSLKKLTLLGETTLEGVQFPGTSLEELVIGKDAVVTCTDDPFRATGDYPAMTSLKKVSILGTFISSSPDKDTKTFWKCFSSNADLTEVVLSGENAINFSRSAFPNVTTLSILGGEATFPGYTLGGDSKLEQVTIDVDKYNSNSASFRYAKNLKTFRLKANSANLDDRAFVECPSLVAVDLTECSSITYGDNTFGSMITNDTNNAPTPHTAIIYVNNTSADPKKAANKAGLSDSHGIVAITNGGTFAENTTFEVKKLATPTKEGYTFGGWYASANFSGGTVTTPEAGKTYYAKWEQSSYFVAPSLTFDSLTYGSTPVPQTLTVSGVENPSVTSVTGSDSFNATYNGANVTITPKTGLPVGTYSETIIVTTGDGATHNVNVSLTVTKADSEVTPGNKNVVTGTYGDTITLTAKVAKKSAETAAVAAIDFYPEEDQVAFWYGDTKLGTATVSYTENDTGTATLHYDTSKGGIPVGSQVFVIATYGGGDNLDKNFTNSIKVQLSPKALTTPVLTNYTATTTSITVTAPTVPTGASKVQYSIDNGTKWQDSNVFSGLSSGTSYSVTAKFVANDSGNYADSANSTALSARTNRSGGSGGGGTTTYAVTTDSTKNGSVSVSPKNASKGTAVTITVKPDSGYELDKLTITDKNGNVLKLTDKGDGKYSFTMPDGKVEVKAVFAKKVETSPFDDVSADAYYNKAVQWAQEKGITDGISSNLFGPKQPCTRSQIVTFLWRAAGSPEPKSTAAGMTDVVPGSYYAKAVAWAVENGITTGTAEGTFSPNATCTRAQAVTFLARAQNAKATGKTAFSDVPADSYFADAVAWAQANGVTTGTSETTFSPDSDCTRAQIVTFLYRANQGT